MKDKGELLNKAIRLSKETSDIEFKETVNPKDLRDHLKLVKSMVAMANSGGGIILLGVDDNGNPVAGFDADALLNQLEPAKIADQVEKYAKAQIGFEITRFTKGGKEVVAIVVEPSEMPIVFAKTGECGVGPDRETIFQQGTIYFRRGARSVPGDSEMLRQWIERRLKEERERLKKEREKLLENIRAVIQAPEGSEVRIIHQQSRAFTYAPDGEPVRVTREVVVDPNLFYPYRQKEVIAQIAEKLGIKFTWQDLIAIRKVYGIEQRPEYFHRPLKGSPQYAQDFIEWVLDEYRRDAGFIEKARKQWRDMIRR